MEIINIDDCKWDEIVDDEIVHFTRNYCKTYMSVDNSNPLLFYYQDNDTTAYQVMFKRKIGSNLGEYYDLISPYGYGGWIIKGKYNSNIFNEYIELCKRSQCVCEFIRFDLFRTDISKYYGDIKFISHNVVKDVSKSHEKIFDDFERRVKKNIRKAIKNELNVIVDETGERIEEFLEIYYSTMERNHASNNYFFSKDFFKQLSKENSCFFHVESEGKIISTEMVLFDKLCSYSFLGGTIDEFFPLRPNEILKYEIMKWSYDHGLNYFVLGGGYGSDDGIFMYKKGLAPNGIYNFYVGNYIFNQEIYNSLCEENNIEISNDYFPAYRKE